MGILDFDVGLGLGVMDVTKKEVGNYTPAEEVGMDCNSSSLVYSISVSKEDGRAESKGRVEAYV